MAFVALAPCTKPRASYFRAPVFGTEPQLTEHQLLEEAIFEIVFIANYPLIHPLLIESDSCAVETMEDMQFLFSKPRSSSIKCFFIFEKGHVIKCKFL